MKKIIKTLSLLFFVAFLSGCSLSTKGTENLKTTGSIWKSIDGGKTWEVKNKTGEKVSASVADTDILTIAINPYDENNVLFGTISNGIIKTNDGGETLETTNFISEKVYGLLFSPIDGRVIYASGVWQKRGKIFKSSDSGENWEEIFTLAAEGPLVVNMTIDKKNPNVLYASTSDNQVLKSDDAGKSWKNIFQSQAPVAQVVIDSSNSSLVYFNTKTSGVFRSKEGGLNAVDISPQITKAAKGSGEIRLLKTDPINAGWAYLVGSVGILRTKDGGDNWEKVMALDDPKIFPVSSLAISSVDSKRIIYGAAKTVYRSEDAGNTWVPLQVGDPKTVNVLEYSLVNPDVIYLGTRKIKS